MDDAKNKFLNLCALSLVLLFGACTDVNETEDSRPSEGSSSSSSGADDVVADVAPKPARAGRNVQRKSYKVDDSSDEEEESEVVGELRPSRSSPSHSA